MALITQLSRDYAMKRIACAVLLLTISLLLVACVCDSEENDDSERTPTVCYAEPDTVDKEHSGSNVIDPIDTTDSISEKYGVLQKIIDTYGFPLEFEMMEGMEKTEIILYDGYAERDWRTNNRKELTENLLWQISGNILEISGNWEESFNVDIDAGTMTSLSTQKEYRLLVHDGDDFKWYTDLPNK